MFNLPFLLSRGFDGIAVFVTIFWIWVLIDCVTKESSEGNDRIVWLLIILFAPVIGVLLYYFVRRPERIKALGQ
ncbi:MAG TPA: PLD nuclease N-terminal domain-containing protein [Ktedonobacteraceae bacterium]|nr:PLD nuclease N-terminal domain-containing protein [Ktedonobacteraceae bacterium]